MSHKNHIAPLQDPHADLEYGSWKQVKTEMSKSLPLKDGLSEQQRKEREAKFDTYYKELGDKCKPEEKRIDYVLVHPKEIEDEDDKNDLERRDNLRERYEFAMKEDGLQKQIVTIDDKIYTKLHVPFKRLCEEAEKVSLEMPLSGCESEHKDEANFFNNWVKRTFITDSEVDMVSAPFRMERMHIYQDSDDPTNFFRPSIRSLLVEHILINIDLRHSGCKENYKHAGKTGKTVGNCWGCIKDDNEILGDMQKVGLDYMMLEEVYTEKFILHEESAYDPDNKQKNETLLPSPGLDKSDPRLAMHFTWTRFFKFQPLWKIRNYFGEKIAFYFAWSGTLIATLWLPMIFGFCIFLFGLVKSIEKTLDGREDTSTSGNSTLTDLFKNVKESFDNDVTPYFALFISIWGTLFLEVWKRKQAELAYQWDVEQFEENEPDRPEFYGTKERVDPVTNERDWYYPFARKAWKICLSSMMLLFMVCIVIVSVMAVIVYRVVATIDYCPDLPDSECLLVSTIISSLLNAISILILGKLYDILARKLTEWENHRTETTFNDALIIKLFAFQFVNNYASCFYIAFFRGRFDDYGILGRGSEYQDNCEGTCMSQLSFQVLILMLTKPIPKFLSDIILPWVKKQFKKRCQCCACLPFLKSFLAPDKKSKEEKTLLELECEKPSLGNFTLPEYTEKIIQYGLMMLFAASFPLAPLLALLTNLVDLRLDAYRMLWVYQRPMAIIAEDIGTWFVILTFMNYTGVVSNAFLIAFTSSWGSHYDLTGKLWIVIGFEHIVFSMKFLLAYLIPDVPSSVALAMRKKRFKLLQKVEELDSPTGNAGTSLRKDGLELPAYIARENTQGANPFNRVRKPLKKDYDDNETEIRKMKRKKKSVLNKDENPDVFREGSETPQDYSRRVASSKVIGPQGEELTEFSYRY